MAHVKVTVRDVTRPDHVLQEWPAHMWLPYVGTNVALARQPFQAKREVVRVAGYTLVMASEDGPAELHMLVTVG